MSKKIDLAGHKFGRLIAQYETEGRKSGHVVWHCVCDCGKETDVQSNCLQSGNTQSCGCINGKAMNKEEKRIYDREYYSNHREKKIEQQIKYRSSNKDKIKKLSHERYSKYRSYLKNYGITLDEYNGLLIKQNNECKICHKHITQSKHAFAVDHDHDTGIVRGLLCSKCNSALGLFEDNANVLLSALIYLKGEL